MAVVPTVVSASAHASAVVPTVATEAEGRLHAEPDANDNALLARTATMEIAVAGAVVMMSGVGTNCGVAEVENPDCT